ncbi:glycosyltransferase family 2 protein [Nesterenkonia flava]|uniref:Glycosyltransferase family 2 protein n=1 Tax=Nesterenkonia flava TaxID=469799 RepID=A0ABU1FQ43_9MICC|nr:glycosyltransferase family 2 protein [Nesterenkonia flava]MDR5710772.1 glycosyltransferase family 2 protein [Nesterenkonia flava]
MSVGTSDNSSLYGTFSQLSEPRLQALALQTRSFTIRDYLAKIVTGGTHGYGELIGSLRSSHLRVMLKPRVAVLLARIVAGQRLFPEDFWNSLVIYECLVRLYGESVLPQEDQLVYLDLLDRAGRADDVGAAVESLRVAQHSPVDAAALVANAALTRNGAGSEEWLKAFNSVLSMDGLAPLTLSPGTAPVLDRLESTSAAASVDGPLVTVVLTTWNPGPWLWTAVRSLTQQTYGNQEILVMDDSSGPQFEPLLNCLLSMDSRIRVITSRENQGTYASRNAAVREHARGVYVTIQDDDDWSHPERIERQVSFSESQGLALGMCRAARVTEDVRFVRRASTFIRRGYPSTMIARATFSEHGYWDPVRRNSDAEYIRRVHRAGKLTRDQGRAPLMLQRDRDGSLSSAEVWEGYSEQSRRWQNWLSAEWHDRSVAIGTSIYMGAGTGLARPYAAPLGLKQSKQTVIETRVNSLIIGDCALGNPNEARIIALAEEQLSEGKTVGLLHVDGLRPLAKTVSKEMAALTRTSGVELLSWSDETVADIAHIVDADALALCDSVQSVVSARCAVMHSSADNVDDLVVNLLHLDSSLQITSIARG